MIIIHSAFLLRVGRENDKGRIQSVFVGCWDVSQDCPSDREYISSLRGVFRWQKHVQKVVVLVAFGRIDTGENLVLVAQFGRKGIVSLSFPRFTAVLFLNLIPGRQCQKKFATRSLVSEYLSNNSGSVESLAWVISAILEG